MTLRPGIKEARVEWYGWKCGCDSVVCANLYFSRPQNEAETCRSWQLKHRGRASSRVRGLHSGNHRDFDSGSSRNSTVPSSSP